MKKIYLHTLGCKVNQYDSQAMLEQFLSNNYECANSAEEADVCVVNTCTVTSVADKKSIQIANRLKKSSPNCELIICGCLAQNKPEDLIKTGARLIIGTQYRHKILELFNKALKDNIQLIAVEPLEFSGFESLNIKGHKEHTRAVIKIQEGCEYNCSYCIIPKVRGNLRSQTIDNIIKEATTLASSGFKEVVLTGINLSCYGNDLNDGLDLVDVISRISKIDSIKRIRLSSLEPNLINEDIAKRLAQCKKLCPQFHLALQSGSDTVLTRMRRRYNTKIYLNAVNLLTNYIPNCTFTTDIIVGFPGETNIEFNETLNFINKIEFIKVHVFPYSPRKDTDAAIMPTQINQTIKKERSSKLIESCKLLTSRVFNKCINNIYSVLIEEEIKANVWRGFTEQYMPVEITGTLIKGDIVNVKIINVVDEKLIAKLA